MPVPIRGTAGSPPLGRETGPYGRGTRGWRVRRTPGPGRPRGSARRVPVRREVVLPAEPAIVYAGDVRRAGVEVGHRASLPRAMPDTDERLDSIRDVGTRVTRARTSRWSRAEMTRSAANSSAASPPATISAPEASPRWCATSSIISLAPRLPRRREPPGQHRCLCPSIVTANRVTGSSPRPNNSAGDDRPSATRSPARIRGHRQRADRHADVIPPVRHRDQRDPRRPRVQRRGGEHHGPFGQLIFQDPGSISGPYGGRPARAASRQAGPQHE